ncbi:uncharacterized protein N7443_000089 [Penicillium atrosanguineum]|uniref:uncharacterized protein n=1 Tax=Penicillium atrosanguineum TaxID=1132637 RepID=UPI0023A402A2|nr:uncharacterized protein N7443_000089 [Penicillium atrosanguineum]KAJ5313205.1 hypothetical protein N7443_000089 [Penicillium atrosanguineum]
MEVRAPLSYGDYTVGWICALPVETAAAKLMLDEIHPPLPRLPMDQNTYILGSIGEHNVVIASLPSGVYGNTSAATVGMQLLSSFHSIRIGFMVGIGGGVPSSNLDIRLGDIVVSRPTDTSGGVIQYDLGKALSGGQLQRTGMLNRPPKVLLTALATLQAYHLTEDSRVVEFISNIQAKMPPRKATTFARPTQEDCLFQAEYDHIGSNTCMNCDRSKLSPRPSRDHEEPIVHYGLIGSANQVVKDGRWRDQLARDLGVYCLEMEAAGLTNDFPCLVIRGICDYADSHKNKEWQGYAAAVAAAYAKELLLVVPIDQIETTPTARDTLADSVHHFNVPLDLTTVPVIENFVGRQDELDSLWQYLRPTSSPSRKVAILHGLGGMGKTQLAIRFARDHKDDFTAIFWLSGKDRDALLRSFSFALNRVPGQLWDSGSTDDREVEQRARHMLRWLGLEGNSRWLIILDNIDQYSPLGSAVGDGYDIGEFFPAADHGSILITSRLQGLTELGEPFPVPKLNTHHTIRLLLQSSGLSAKNTARKLESDPGLFTLASRLDGLPLAIVLAGAFMRETGTSITEYLEYYRESWSELQLESSPGRQYQQGNMIQTWMISYLEIQKRDPNAAALLLLFARFDNRDIWYELVKNGSHCLDVPFWLKKAISSGLAFKIGVKTLIGFSLLESKQQEGSYAMHPVVQDWCLHLASTDENVNSIQLDEIALISVGYAVPSSSDKNYTELQQRLIPHANYTRHRNCLGHDISVWGAFQGLGNLYTVQGMLNEAEAMYDRALAGYEKALGPDHTSTLNTFNNLGSLYRDQGKLKEAEEMFERALAGKKKALGPDHTSTLDTVNNLGLLYKDQGKLKEAEEMYERALGGYERALGPDHTSTLDTVNNLGLLYKDQGKLKEAEEMYERALAGFEKALGQYHKTHLPTLHTANNLALLYRDQGKLKEAEEMFKRALAGYEKALGQHHKTHLPTLNTVSNLGLLYRDQGKLKEAEEMFERALAGKKKALGPDHMSTLNTVNNLGLLYKDQGKLKEAEEMFERALTGYQKALGQHHKTHLPTLNTVNNIAGLYSNQGKLKDAEEMYQRALAGKEKALGPGHTSTLDTVHNLALLYSDQGKLNEAEEMYERALIGYEKALGQHHKTHLPTLNAVNNLAGLYSNQGKLKDAEEMYQRALAGHEKALGPDHMSTLHTVHNLGLLYKDQGKLKEAEEMFERALAGYEKALGPYHRSTLNTVNNLGGVYSNQGKLEEAEEMYQRALAGKEEVLGQDHMSTLDTVNNLGLLYTYQGKLNDAGEMYHRALAGKEKALGTDHTSTLNTVNNLGFLYEYQGKLKEAEMMYQRALVGYEKALGPDHNSTRLVMETLSRLSIAGENSIQHAP